MSNGSKWCLKIDPREGNKQPYPSLLFFFPHQDRYSVGVCLGHIIYEVPLKKSSALLQLQVLSILLESVVL